MDEKDRIGKIMQEVGMNSTQFALETDIKSSTLSHLLNGRNNVSLPVLKQILNRFPKISPEWLIFGTGTMYRQETHSQSPTLFDMNNENDCYAVNYNKEKPQNSSAEKEVIQRKEETKPAEPQPILPFVPPVVEKPPRRIKRIIVYFDDNSFQEFIED